MLSSRGTERHEPLPRRKFDRETRRGLALAKLLPDLGYDTVWQFYRNQLRRKPKLKAPKGKRARKRK